MQSNINIKTKEYSINKKLYRQIVSDIYYRKYSWIVIVYIFSSFTWLYIVQNWLVFVINIPILFDFLLRPYSIVTSQNKLAFQKTRLEIEKDYLTFHYEDGSSFKVRLSNFQYAEKAGEFYCLYVTNESRYLSETLPLYFIPKAAFYTEADLEVFELLLKSINPLKN